MDLGDLFLIILKLIDDECRAELLKLVELQRVEKFKNAMFSGDKINRTEDRSVLHMYCGINQRQRSFLTVKM